MSTFAHHTGPGGRARALRHPIQSLEHEAHLLAEVERAGESGGTLFLAIVGVMCVVVPIGAIMMLLAFGAAALFG